MAGSLAAGGLEGACERRGKGRVAAGGTGAGRKPYDGLRRAPEHPEGGAAAARQGGCGGACWCGGGAAEGLPEGGRGQRSNGVDGGLGCRRSGVLTESSSTLILPFLPIARMPLVFGLHAGLMACLFTRLHVVVTGASPAAEAGRQLDL